MGTRGWGSELGGNLVELGDESLQQLIVFRRALALRKYLCHSGYVARDLINLVCLFQLRLQRRTTVSIDRMERPTFLACFASRLWYLRNK